MARKKCVIEILKKNRALFCIDKRKKLEKNMRLHSGGPVKYTKKSTNLISNV